MAYELKTTKKVKATKYELRYEGGPWADIFLEDWDIGKSGKVLINSDWGTWASSWGAMGDTIRDFLLRIDSSYLIRNLARYTEDHSVFFEEDTIKKIKQGIIKARRDEYHDVSWDKDEARRAWDDIDDVFCWDFESAQAYYCAAMAQNPKWMELWEDPPCERGYHPRLSNFIDNIWPDFLKIIREENP